MTSRFSRHSIPADQHLIAYLVGRLPPGEVERVDELSIVDDAVAERLRAVEDDLVDAYVVGALDESLVVDFESVYLASALRREKVERAVVEGALEAARKDFGRLMREVMALEQQKLTREALPELRSANAA